MAVPRTQGNSSHPETRDTFLPDSVTSQDKDLGGSRGNPGKVFLRAVGNYASDGGRCSAFGSRSKGEAGGKKGEFWERKGKGKCVKEGERGKERKKRGERVHLLGSCCKLL